MDSKRLLKFSKSLLEDRLNLESLNREEKLMLGIFHHTVLGQVPKISYRQSLDELKRFSPDMVRELLDIIDYNLGDIRIREISYEDKEIPLDIYASYNLKQIMVAFGKTTETYDYPLREGVLYIEEKNTDLFFITINKMEEDYLPSTMYNDYAIISGLFIWESKISCDYFLA